MKDIGRLHRVVGAILGLGLLVGAPGLDARAQQSPAASSAPVQAADWLELTTEGTTDAFQPRARLQLERSAYVAVFEVEPGVGATLLYPYGADDQIRLSAGEHGFRLNGLRQAFNRRTMLAHLGWAFAHRDPVVPHNHLVAVASERPLALDGLLSGRVFRYARAFAGAEEITGALLAEVLEDRRAGDWTLATARYLKVRNEPLLFAFRDLQAGAPYLVLGDELQLLGLEDDPRIPALVTCLYGAETLAAFYHGLGAVGPDRDCRRRLASLRLAGVPVPPRRPAASPPERASRDGPGPDEAVPGLDEDGRALLRALADATRTLDDDGRAALERVGVELRRAGFEVPVEGIERLEARSERWRSAVRRRADRLERAGLRPNGRPVAGAPRGRGIAPSPPSLRTRLPSAGRSGGSSSSGNGGARPDRPEVDRPELPDRDRRGGGR